ncbi:hypothetical protein B0J14DRAFT_601461 [Halenospora varia]|nr:hypothetical protein B0J14DRAFT_601461 [Halenospora varia]
MLKVCQQSRRIALSVYEPRLKLYISREKPGQVLCAMPNTISRPEGCVYIYMRKEHPPIDIQPDSKVHSIVVWAEITSGFSTQTVLAEFVNVRYSQNWPPDQDGPVVTEIIRKNLYELYNHRFLPPGFENASLRTSIYRTRSRRAGDRRQQW